VKIIFVKLENVSHFGYIGLQKYKFNPDKCVNKCKIILIFLFLLRSNNMYMNISRKLFIVFLCVFFELLNPARAKSAPDHPFTVIIDPGHGGKDPGAVYKGIREKDIVLNIGIKLGNYLKEKLPGVRVIYTRNTDVFVPLHQRAVIANSNKADLFVSLHANYCGTPSITGTETFVLGLHRSEENLEVAKKENAVILMEEDYSSTYQGFDPNSPESYIMFEMVQDEHLDQSINLAAAIQNQFKNRAGRHDRGVKQAGFLVLRRTSMPSVLVEAGFLSNRYEANYMNSDEGQAYLASAIFRAIRDYKNAVDHKSEYQLGSSIPESLKPSAETTEKALSQKKEEHTNNFYFSVQLAATSKAIEPTATNFKGLEKVERKRIKSTFKFFYGKSNSLEKIQSLKQEIIAKYPDAFIVAFENEEPISIKKALRKIKP